MLVVLPRDQDLERKDRLTPSDFDQQPFIALGAEIGTRSETALFLASENARPRVVAEAQLSASVCEFIASGAGLSIVEPVTATNFANAGKISARPLDPEQPSRYDLLLPALRRPHRAATELVEQHFETLLQP
jgi:DNA-binding transcriptional LysR family regulator